MAVPWQAQPGRPHLPLIILPSSSLTGSLRTGAISYCFCLLSPLVLTLLSFQKSHAAAVARAAARSCCCSLVLLLQYHRVVPPCSLALLLYHPSVRMMQPRRVVYEVCVRGRGKVCLVCI